MLSVTLSDVAGDVNTFNDTYEIPFAIDHVVDRFETQHDRWTWEGWGITVGVIGFDDIYSAHIDSGKIRKRDLREAYKEALSQ